MSFSWPPLATWVPEEEPPASKFNEEIRDRFDVLANLTTLKNEVLGNGSRSSDDWGQLDDEEGPLREFITGPTGVVDFTFGGFGAVAANLDEGFMSYEIVDVDADLQVVGPADWRAAYWRQQVTLADRFTHSENLEPLTRYLFRCLYRVTTSMNVRDRHLSVRGVLEVPE